MVEEIDGTRCRISQPNKGWLSLKAIDSNLSSKGFTINSSPMGYLGRISRLFDKCWLKRC